VIGNHLKFQMNILVSYYSIRMREGHINDYRAFAADCNTKEIQVVVAADIMSLALLTPPGEWGADVVVGNTQRFGVPNWIWWATCCFFCYQRRQ
jgi:glycine dehydrogenase